MSDLLFIICFFVGVVGDALDMTLLLFCWLCCKSYNRFYILLSFCSFLGRKYWHSTFTHI